ncbi:MAG: hypothetical protein ACKOWF_14505 [Chloroflexota bacterium]
MKRRAALLAALAFLAAPPAAAPDDAWIPLSDPSVTETSGLAAAPGGWLLWTIEDSGNALALHAFSPSGDALGAWPIAGADDAASDWEDLAVAPAPDGQGRRLVIADIGDNDEDRPFVTLYVVPEPDPSTAGATLWAERLDFVYPDQPHDAEAILVHPFTGETLVATKKPWGRAAVFRLPPEAAGPLERVAAVNGPGIGPWGAITGGAVAADGSRAALLTYGGIAEWDVAPGQTLAEAIAAPPRMLPRPDIGQTEAIAYSADGTVLYVTAEGRPSRLASIPLDPDR